MDKKILDDFTSASMYPSDCPQLFSDIFLLKKKKSISKLKADTSFQLHKSYMKALPLYKIIQYRYDFYFHSPWSGSLTIILSSSLLLRSAVFLYCHLPLPLSAILRDRGATFDKSVTTPLLKCCVLTSGASYTNFPSPFRFPTHTWPLNITLASGSDSMVFLFSFYLEWRGDLI